MPVPIVCLDARLRQFAEAFAGCFSAPQRRHFVTVLLALVLCREPRTLTGLRRQVAGGRSVAALSRFLSKGKCQNSVHADVTDLILPTFAVIRGVLRAVAPVQRRDLQCQPPLFLRFAASRAVEHRVLTLPSSGRRCGRPYLRTGRYGPFGGARVGQMIDAAGGSR